MRAPSDDPPLVSRRFVCFSFTLLFALFIAHCFVLWSPYASKVFDQEWLPVVPGPAEQRVGEHVWRKSREPTAHVEIDDKHPIRGLMHQADEEFRRRERDRSKTFKETVEKYRRKYGRHPPPGFKEWYKFARERKIHNIDDFQQVHDDLRPFWAVPPADIRHYAAHASDKDGHGVATISLRDGQVFQETWGWRSETFISMLEPIAAWLPDMDIPMNRMDQPRVVVPWKDMQEMLKLEERTRSLDEEDVEDSFTKDLSGLWKPNPQYPESSWWNQLNPFVVPHDHVETAADPRPPYGWFHHTNKPFMDVAAKACPPESYARNANSEKSLRQAESSYKHDLGGFITNFNRSSDLCTVGPQLAHLHGMLYAATSMLVTKKLVPIFSECKTNVNNDILFPANMYWKQDKRYVYDDEQDINWDDKDDLMPWRGVTSGGTAYEKQPERWRSMHRQRLVLMTNSTELSGDTTSILALSDQEYGEYSAQDFVPAAFMEKYTDIGFTNTLACVPNCHFYDSVFAMQNKTTFADTFKSKYLIDVDGHSFSGRWRAYLQSRSLGIKATIFREWHSSRLRAWRHFVPVDNRYDELYSLLTYFIGVDSTQKTPKGDLPHIDKPVPEVNKNIAVERHDFEAFKIAKQGRDWAAKVLRKEDIEIYLFRLLLEYGRIIDDNRDRIGFVGDGGQEMEDFDREFPAVD